jgi:hypothetical protein
LELAPVNNVASRGGELLNAFEVRSGHDPTESEWS